MQNRPLGVSVQVRLGLHSFWTWQDAEHAAYVVRWSVQETQRVPFSQGCPQAGA
jgi:hypothetical protein